MSGASTNLTRWLQQLGITLNDASLRWYRSGQSTPKPDDQIHHDQVLSFAVNLSPTSTTRRRRATPQERMQQFFNTRATKKDGTPAARSKRRLNAVNELRAKTPPPRKAEPTTTSEAQTFHNLLAVVEGRIETELVPSLSLCITPEAKAELVTNFIIKELDGVVFDGVDDEDREKLRGRRKQLIRRISSLAPQPESEPTAFTKFNQQLDNIEGRIRGTLTMEVAKANGQEAKRELVTNFIIKELDEIEFVGVEDEDYQKLRSRRKELVQLANSLAP